MNRSSKFYFRWFCAFGLVFFTVRAFSQSPDLKFEHFIDDKELSQSSVMKVLQDREGYLWMVTPNGLYKYDGKTFTIFPIYDISKNVHQANRFGLVEFVD